MIIGVTATALTFVSLIVSITAYFLYYKRKDIALLKIARSGFYSASVLIIFQTALLLYGILSHRFEWVYVFSYSSRDLPLYYLISTFWAGQEGTFVLWLFLGSIYGFVIIRANRDEEPLVMSFMSLVQAYIVMILIKKNPFTYVWEMNPAAFQAGVVPPDGNGLNPLLQDPWMTIHPPVLFAGYSATMILFAFAMSALIKRNYDNWIRPVYPYVLFVGLSLGAGIILGGYWAYTTLGWGGYWAWDPVENSSLIPWLTSLVLIHGILIQKKQGGMKKTNIFLALATFVLVLYGSFLTRSGVLTDFSVHSFGSSELTLYLSGFVVFFLALSLLAFIFRSQEVKGERVQTALFTRESFLLFGMLIMLVLAVLTFFGTSSPIITGLFGTASNVSIEYYNLIAKPVAILFALFIAISPVLQWKKSSEEKLKQIVLHFAASVLIGIAAFILGMRDAVSLIITTLAVFVILVNGAVMVSMIRNKNYAFGGYFSHVGVGLMIIGIITSSIYDKSTKVKLPKDTTVDVMGHDLQYTGRIPSPDGKDKVVIKIGEEEAYANFYWSEYNRAYMVGPTVKNLPFKDLYISPIQIIPAEQSSGVTDNVTLKKEQPVRYEDFTFTFTGYDMGEHGMGSSMDIAAVVKIADVNGNMLGTIKPAIHMEGEERHVHPVDLLESGRKVYLNGISVENNSIALAVTKGNQSDDPYAGKEVLAAEVSVKPLINLLWLGTVLMMIGFLMSTYQNRKKNSA